MIRNLIAALAALVLVLFVGACENTTDTNPIDDTGDTPEGMAQYTATVFYPDRSVAEVTLKVRASSSTDVYDGVTGDPMELPAPQTYQVIFGDLEGQVTGDDQPLPIITDAFDYTWVHPAVDLQVEDGDEVEGSYTLNTYLNLQMNCELTDWIWYNEQWSSPETYIYGNVQIQVFDGYRLEFDENELMDFMIIENEGQELVFYGNSLTVEGPRSDEVWVEEFQYSPGEALHLVTVFDEFAKSDLVCQ